MLKEIYFIQSLDIFYILDILWTFAFAIAGAYKARSLWLNIFAVIALGMVTAIWGWTIRDLVIWRVPLFYIEDINYILFILIASLIAFLLPKLIAKAYSIFRFIDSIWLSIFVIIWTNIWFTFFLQNLNNYNLLHIWIISVLLWMITWFWWWVIRDSIIWQTPYAFKKNANYVTASFLGASVYFIFTFTNIILAIVVSFLITMTYREIVSPYWIVSKLYFNRKK